MEKNSFWKYQPLKVSPNEVKRILTDEEVLLKVEKEIENQKFKLDYSVNEDISSLFSFIDENYLEDNKLKISYPTELLKYATRNSLILEFYPKGKKTMVGCILGRKCVLSMNDVLYEDVEVNFLCISLKLRSLGIAPYMISVLTKETVLRFKIAIGHCTIGSKIKSPYFSEKKFYHRLFNIKKLIDTSFLSPNTNLKVYKKLHNTFKNDESYIIQKENFHIEELYDLFMSYSKNTYTIYEKITFEDFKLTFENNSFTHFLIKDKDDNIVSYISMFVVNVINKENNLTYRNGYYYNMFFKDINECTGILDAINQNIYLNEIYDVTTLVDIFEIKYDSIKFINGTGILRYYMWNMNLDNPIPNHKNSLVTI